MDEKKIDMVAVRIARNRYMKKWRAKNKKKVTEHQNRFWLRQYEKEQANQQDNADSKE